MNASVTLFSDWFAYTVRVQPRHTDYAGIVWHGSYLEWMEAARIEVFRNIGLEYADLVQWGCDLPVVDLSLQYRQPMRMGTVAVVKSRLRKLEKVRLRWEQNVFCDNNDKACVLGQITLVPFNSESGRILRKVPKVLQDAIDQIVG